MSGIGEAVGDAVQGALLARAVEPAQGEAVSGHTQESACLNCGTALLGPHCHACGQAAHVHRSLAAFFHDLLHGVLHFEGKIWRTLPLLAWRPGQLTREYIDGRRASYVSPIALFLFVVFLSFALFSALGGSNMLDPQADPLGQVKSAYTANEKELARLRTDTGQAEVDKRIAALEQDQNRLKMVLGNVGSEFEKGLRAGFEESPLPQGNRLTEAVERVQANPQLAIYKLQTNAYKYSWMLIPLSVPFVWLLFPFSRRFGFYDHTVFATYSIAFMIALVALVSLLGFFDAGGFGVLLLLYAPLHMYRQLRGTYDLGRGAAAWRMLALSLFAWVAIGLFAGLIMLGAGV